MLPIALQIGRQVTLLASMYTQCVFEGYRCYFSQVTALHLPQTPMPQTPQVSATNAAKPAGIGRGAFLRMWAAMCCRICHFGKVYRPRGLLDTHLCKQCYLGKCNEHTEELRNAKVYG
jgi:hypothetical protein